MRQLLNTLFVTSEDIYLSLDGENVVANRGGEAVARYPLHTLQSIVSFSYAGASPALMGACAQREIGLAFCSPRGKFLARVAGQAQGNVLLRRMQYRMADDLELLWTAILNMFENDHSAARGKMAVRELIVFKHNCELGCAPAHKLFDLVKVEHKDGVTAPRSYGDYTVSVDETHLPSGVTCTRMG